MDGGTNDNYTERCRPGIHGAARRWRRAHRGRERWFGRAQQRESDYTGSARRYPPAAPSLLAGARVVLGLQRPTR